MTEGKIEMSDNKYSYVIILKKFIIINYKFIISIIVSSFSKLLFWI